MEKIDLTRKMIILDPESYAAVKANNMTLDDLSDTIFGTMDILSVDKKKWEEKKFVRGEIRTDNTMGEMSNHSGDYNLYDCDMLDSAEKHLSKLFNISRNDLRYLLSKSNLYFSLFNLTNYGYSLGYLLSNKWYANGKTRELESIYPIENYSVDLENIGALGDWWNRSGELGDSYKDKKYLKHVTDKGIIIVLGTDVIKNLMTKDKNTIVYFYEDMLCELSKFVDKKVLYKTDLYINYLNI